MRQALFIRYGCKEIEFLLSEKLYRKLTGVQFITLHILCHYGKANVEAICARAC